MWKRAGVLAVVLAMGCASGGGRGMMAGGTSGQSVAPRSDGRTASGKPEVVVQGATKKEVMDALTVRMVSAGWNVAQTNEYQAIYEIDAKGAAGFLSGVMYGSATQPIHRVTAQFLDTPVGVRVIAGTELVSNPGTPRTTRTEMNSGKTRRQIQELLDAVRNDTAKASSPSPAAADSAGKH